MIERHRHEGENTISVEPMSQLGTLHREDCLTEMALFILQVSSLPEGRRTLW